MSEKTFTKPFEEMDNKELKRGIKKKFGNVSRFYKITGRDQYKHNLLFRLKRTPENLVELRKMYNDALIYQNEPVKNEVTEALIKRIKKAIKVEYDTTLEFCKEHPQFKNTWISLLTHGHVKTQTKQVKELMKVLGMSTEDKAKDGEDNKAPDTF